MNQSHRLSWATIVFFALAMMGCASQGVPPQAFTAQSIPDGNYNLKVQQLYFVLDASASMEDGYKFDTARGVVEHFNQTMPAVDVQTALRSFGHHPSVTSAYSALFSKLQPYNRSGFDADLKNIHRPGGFSPLGRALKDAAGDLSAVKDKIAMIIVSDGLEMDGSPLAAAQALKDAHGDRLCIYTIWVGDSTAGQSLLAKIATVNNCGRALSAGDVAAGASMNAFVKEVLLAGIADSDGDGVADDKDQCPNTPRGVQVDSKGCPLDSDQDGVPDYKDKCPGTPRGTSVDAKGCPLPVASKSAEVTKAGTWLYKDIQFETNKWDLKASSYPTLDEIVAALKAQPNLRVEIQGHTDSMGARSYNQQLSERRAKSVRAYLASKGIELSRMEARGYGPDRPIESNATSKGRARNRRVEIKPIQ